MKKPEPQPPVENSLQSIASLCGTLVTGLFVLTFIFQNFAIPSASMASRLMVGDHVLVDRASLAPPSSGPRPIPFSVREKG
jgi:signal peptidase I